MEHYSPIPSKWHLYNKIYRFIFPLSLALSKYENKPRAILFCYLYDNNVTIMSAGVRILMINSEVHVILTLMVD